MTTYTTEQLGPIEVKPVSTKTRTYSVALVVVHGDGDQTTVAQPLTAGAGHGRRRTLEMIAAGIDLDDIRIAIIPSGTVGGDEATDGMPLLPVRRALWWTVDDDRECGDTPRHIFAQNKLGGP